MIKQLILAGAVLFASTSDAKLSQDDYDRCLFKGMVTDYTLTNRAEYTRDEMIAIMIRERAGRFSHETLIDSQRIIFDMYRGRRGPGFRHSNDIKNIEQLVQLEIKRCVVNGY
jgi:hypothetical protein